MTFRTLVADTGLTKVELMKLYQVSRQTIYYWIKHDLPQTGAVSARRALAVSRALTAFVQRGGLPLAPMGKGDRQKRIAALASALENIKPAALK